MPSRLDHQMTLVVPTIDISAYLRDPSSPAAGMIIEEIRNACLSTGFFQILGHGLPREVQGGILAAGKRFFALDFGEKKKLDAKTTIGHRGYDVLASQSYLEGVLPDLKEGFYVAEDIPDDDPRVIARRLFMGTNVWPPTSLIQHKDMKEPVEAYYKAIYNLSLVVLEMVARTLPYGPHVFDRFISDNPIAPLRMLHYPPAGRTNKPQFGSSAHTDFGAITLLLQDENPGLQVQDPLTEEWIPIPPNPDAYVVNIGDMLSKWTGGQYKSSVHRVLNRNPTDRYSIVFFFDGNLDCPLSPFDGKKVEGEVETVEGHMLRRLAESYGKKE